MTIANMGQLFSAAIDAIPESHRTNPRSTVAGVPVEIYDADAGIYRPIRFETTSEGVRLVIGGAQQ